MKLCGSVNWYRIGWLFVIFNLLLSPLYTYSQNLPPVIDRGIPNQHTEVEPGFAYTIPSTAFKDENYDNLTYTTNTLPGWLSFNSATRTFTGTPTTPGTTTVTVTATDPSGTDSKYSFKIYVHTKGSTYAAFTMDTQTGCNYRQVNFTNLSKNATSFEWSFGNGNTSTETTPSAIYGKPGTYTVKLIINGGGLPEYTLTETITIYPLPNPQIGNIGTTGCEPVDLTFKSTGFPIYVNPVTVNGQTVGEITGASEAYYYWYFSGPHDGQLSTSKDTIITGFEGGKYQAFLTVTDANGCKKQSTTPISFEVYDKPEVDFDIFKTDICTPSNTDFRNTSQILAGDSITKHEWFLNGIKDGSSKDYSHFFINYDTYTIKLIETSSHNCVSDTTKQLLFNADNNADFSFNTPSCLGDTINFKNKSTETIAYKWDFNSDNITDSEEQNPKYVFPTSGFHQVSLQATFNDGCIKPVIKSINIDEVNAHFSYAFIDACAPDFEIEFTDQSTTALGTPIFSRKWFLVNSDNSTTLISNSNNPFRHLFPGNGGTYRIRLVASTENGCSSSYEEEINTGQSTITINPSGAVFGCVVPGAPTSFTVNLSLGHDTPSTYTWDFGDSGTGSGPTPTHIYTAAGDFNVGVSITTVAGCTYSASMNNAVRLGAVPTISGVTIDQSVQKCFSEGIELIVNSSANTDSLKFITKFATLEQALPDNTFEYQFPDTGTYKIDVIAKDNGCPSIPYSVTNIKINEPRAMFSPTQTTFCNNPPYVATFTNESSYTNPATTFSWNFGDGNTSNLPSPTHQYLSTGDFTVTLNVTNPSTGCTDSHSETLHIYSFDNATGIITASAKVGCAPFLVDFGQKINERLSPNYIVKEYQWDFDNDGYIDDTVTSPSIQHIFTKPGEFSVRLVAISENGDCNFEFIDPNLIKVNGPIVNFDFTPAIACLNENINFTNTSTKPIFDSANPANDKYIWNFGDNTTSTEQNPVKFYDRDSVFTVSLNVTDQNNCSSTLEKKNLITINAIEASFELTDTIYCKGTTVTFTNNSSGIISSYQWDFDNNGTVDKTTNNTDPIQWTFNTPGNFYPKLVAIAPNGCTKTDSTKIRISNSTANFSANGADTTIKQINIGCAPAFANFAPAANSDEVKKYSWNFGDGNGSTERAPRNYYVNPGTYTVTLTIEFKGGCTDFIEKKDFIKVDGAFGKLDYDKTLGCLPNPIVFSVSEMSRVSIISWDFGKGVIESDTLSGSTTYKERNYSYTSGGYASPTIILTDAVCGEYSYKNNIKGSIYTSTPPIADFSVDKDSICRGVEIHFTDKSTSPDPIYKVNRWKWYFGNTGNDSSSVQNPPYAYTEIGTYKPQLIATNQLGCSDTIIRKNSIHIFGNDLLTSDFTINDATACANQAIKFDSKATAGPSTISKYEWDFGAGYSNQRQHQSETYSWGENFKGATIQIIHKVTDDKECTASTIRTVEIDNLQAAFGYSPQPVLRGSLVDFSNTSNRGLGNLNSYQWSFENGNPPSSTIRNPKVQYETIGTDYETQLIIGNTNGCKDTTALTFNVENNLPVADSFRITLVENHSRKFKLSEFTSNFDPKDPNQGFDSIRFESIPAEGSLMLKGNPIGVMQNISVTDISSLLLTIHNWNGESQALWSGFDGIDWSASATIFITVIEEPDPPILNNIVFDVREDSVVKISITDFIKHINTTALEYDSLILKILSTITVPGCLLTFDGNTFSTPMSILCSEIDTVNQSFAFTPSHGSNDTYSFQWNAYDGYNFSNTPANVIIKYHNTPPNLTDIVRTGLPENEMQDGFEIDFNSNYSDIDKYDNLQSFKLINIPFSDGDFYLGIQKITSNNYTIQNADLNRLRFYPKDGFEGTTEVIWGASDGTDISTAKIILTFVNTPPIVHNFVVNGSEDNVIQFNEAHFSVEYPNGPFQEADKTDNLTAIRITSLPLNGTLKYNGSQVTVGDEFSNLEIKNLTYSSNLDWFGSDEFKYNAFDGTDWAAVDATAILQIQAVNDAPRPEADVWSIDEDVKLTGVSVATNDTDVDDLKTALTYSVAETDSFTAGLYGTIDLRQDGNLTFTPDRDYVGTVYFVYTVCDDDIACATDTVTITIRPLNDAPVATDDVFEIEENEPSKNFNCLTNDGDVDGDPIAITTIDGDLTGSIQGIYGTLNWDLNGNLTFTLNSGLDSMSRSDVFTDIFTYEIADTSHVTSTAKISIHIYGQNDPPVANGNFFWMYEGDQSMTNLDEDFGFILKNDTDPDGDPIAVVGVFPEFPEKYGTLSWQSNGSWTFTQNLNATDSLKSGYPLNIYYTYTISDGVDSISLNNGITIQIVGINDAPVAADNYLTIDEDVTSITIDIQQPEALLSNDTDVDHDNLSVVGVEDDLLGSYTSNVGTLNWNADGSYTYTPNPDTINTVAAGDWITDIFEYSIKDDFDSIAKAKLIIIINGINDAPIAVNDFLDINEDDHFTEIADSLGLLSNDNDIDRDPIVVAVNGQDNSYEQHGEYGTLIWQPNGSYTYTTDIATVDTLFEGETMTDIFQYTVLDKNNAKSTAQLTITITGQNDAPVAENHYESMLESDSVLIQTTRASGILNNCSDIDDNEDFGIISIESTHGKYGELNWTADGIFSYTLNADIDTLAALEMVIDSFYFEIKDRFDSIDQAYLIINITGENDVPRPQNDTLFVTENDLVIEHNTQALSLLYNDKDPDGDSFEMNSFNVQTGSPTDTKFAKFNWNIDGTYNYNRYTHADLRDGLDTLAFNDVILDSIPYSIIDKLQSETSAYLYLEISGRNDNPIAFTDSNLIVEDTPFISSTEQNQLLANDYDIDRGDSIDVSRVNYDSKDTVDGVFGTFVWRSNGSYTYTPDSVATNPLYEGERVRDVFKYTIFDTQNTSAHDSLIITIVGVNDNPIAGNDTITLTEDQRFVDIVGTKNNGVLQNDSDIDGDSIFVKNRYNLYQDTIHGIYGLLTIDATGISKYELNAEIDSLALGVKVIDTFTYIVSDTHTATDSAMVVFEITGVNDAPLASNDYILIAEDTVSIAIPADSTVAILSNDSDIDNDPLKVISINNSASPFISTYGELQWDSTGAYQFIVNKLECDKLAFGDTVNEQFSYVISDINNGLDSAVLNISIYGVNDPPVALEDTFETFDYVPIITTATDENIRSNDFDVDGTEYPVSKVNDSGNIDITGVYGSLSWAPDGSFTYEPDSALAVALRPDELNVEQFEYIITDKFDATDTSSITINIWGINNNPIAYTDTLELREDDISATHEAIVGLLANDKDPDRDTLSVISMEGGSNHLLSGIYGELFWTENGKVEFTPYRSIVDQLGYGEYISEKFTYSITDGAGLTASSKLIVLILGQNDPIVATNDYAQIDEDKYLHYNVVDNDVDVDNDSLGNVDYSSLTILTEPKHGKAYVNSFNGEISYFPNKDFFGTDSLQYQICDKGDPVFCDNAWFIIRVESVNDIPVAKHLSFTTMVDESVQFNAFDQVSDVDDGIDSTSLVITKTDKITRTGDTISFISSEMGIFEFTYSVSDFDKATATVIVTVVVKNTNDSYAAQNDTVSTLENIPITFPIIANDTIGGHIPDPLSVNIKIYPEHGIATYDVASKTITYQPEKNVNGTDSLIYLVGSTSGYWDFATVFIHVKSVNSPIIVRDDAIAIFKGETAILPILKNDFDLDNGIDTVSVLITQPLNGNSTFNNNSGKLTYTPNSSFTGFDSLNYSACDLDLEISSCNTAKVTVLVKSEINPIANNDFYTTNEGKLLVIDNPHPIDNDTDASDETTTIDRNSFKIIAGPQFGSYSIDANNIISYTPDSNFFGLDKIIYQICDNDNNCDFAEINIWVNEVYTPPVANDDNAVVTENATQRIFVLNNDFDIDGELDWNSLKITTPLTSIKGDCFADKTTGTILYTLPSDTNEGTDEFTYEICDTEGKCASAKVFVIVDLGSTIIKKLITDEDTPVKFALAPLLAEKHLFFSVDNANELVTPEIGSWTLSTNKQELIYTPEQDSSGTDYFNVTICSANKVCADLRVYVTINPINDAPVAVTDTVVWNTGSTTTTISFDHILKNDYDVDRDSIILAKQIVDLGDSLHISINYPDSTITISADTILWCDAWFKYKISDPYDSSAIGFVFIMPVLEGITANADSISIDENTSADFDVLINDEFKDKQRCTIDTIFIVTPPQNGVAASTSYNFVNYRPTDHYYGIDSLEYAIKDIWGQLDTAWVLIDVIERNTLPVAQADEVTVNFDSELVIQVLANDYDPDPDGYIDTLQTHLLIGFGPTSGTVRLIAETGEFIYTPFELTCNGDQFMYTIFDNEGDSASAIVNIKVPSEVPLTAVADTVETWPGVPVEFNPIANDMGYFYPSIEQFDQPLSGLLEQNNDSTLTYRPNADFFSRDSVLYTIVSPCGNEQQGWIVFVIKELRVPEIITPNGDGKNDVLIIEGIEYFPDALLQIFNRYGHLVYQRKAYENDWGGGSNQGSFLGDDTLPSGPYYYTLKYNEARNKQAGLIYIYR